MQKPPLPLKQPTKFTQISPTSYISDKKIETLNDLEENPLITPENENFFKIFEEKAEVIEFLKSKLSIAEVSNSQLKAAKAKLLNDLEDKNSENRLEITRLRKIIEEKLMENDNLTSRLMRFDDINQENSHLQEKISELEFSNKSLTAEFFQRKEYIIELESENSLLNSQNKSLEAELKELNNYKKTNSNQITKKNEQIESLRRYVNNLEYKFKELERIKSLERDITLMGAEIERLQRLLLKKSQENEVYKVKIMECQKTFKQMGNYEKTISNLTLEIEKLKNKGFRSDFDLKASDYNNDAHQNNSKILKDPKQVLYGEIDRMNNLFKNEHQDFESINREYQKVVKENIGLIEKVEGFENETNQLKMMLRGKEREVNELRISREDDWIEKTLEKKKMEVDANTFRKFSGE